MRYKNFMSLKLINHIGILGITFKLALLEFRNSGGLFIFNIHDIYTWLTLRLLNCENIRLWKFKVAFVCKWVPRLLDSPLLSLAKLWNTKGFGLNELTILIGNRLHGSYLGHIQNHKLHIYRQSGNIFLYGIKTAFVRNSFKFIK